MRLLFAIPPNEYRQHVGGAHGLKNAPRLLPMTQQIEHCVASSVIVMDRDCGRWIGAAGAERELRGQAPFYGGVGDTEAFALGVAVGRAAWVRADHGQVARPARGVSEAE